MRLVLMLIGSMGLFGCVSDCNVSCPSPCVPISFTLTEDSVSIQTLQTPPYVIQEISLETITSDLESENLFQIQPEKFSFVGCDGSTYRLILDENNQIEINVHLETFSKDECCSFFTASSITFNGTELCSAATDQCSGGAYEL
ncbi:MAG: hypothetical protein NXI20_05165 [bacterium]|nr:hypothetical protein [bacterium]